MRIQVFLSYPRPFLKKQEEFINKIKEHLEERGFCPRTLGVTDYDMDAPLVGIRKLMLRSNALLTIAFRRAYIEKGIGKPKSDIDDMNQYDISDKWITSPYCHIEPAMAFQIGLPVLVFREKGVIDDGILEKGVLGTYMPEFDLSKPIDKYFSGNEWKQLISKWESMAREVFEKRKEKSKLY